MTTTGKHLLSEIVAGLDGVPALLRSRIGSEFDGECHLTETEALAIAAYVEQLEKALEPFAAEANRFAETWPNGTRERPDKFNLGDLRRARAALGGSNE